VSGGKRRKTQKERCGRTQGRQRGGRGEDERRKRRG
jgi:hypothetical protein